MEHYPYGRLFDFDGSDGDLERFNARGISVTGVLCGNKVKMSSGTAGDIEKDFNDVGGCRSSVFCNGILWKC